MFRNFLEKNLSKQQGGVSMKDVATSNLVLASTLESITCASRHGQESNLNWCLKKIHDAVVSIADRSNNATSLWCLHNAPCEEALQIPITMAILSKHTLHAPSRLANPGTVNHQRCCKPVNC
jgi:hypothetical protein